jgi:membrane protease YdiL (CAAX protease family)
MSILIQGIMGLVLSALYIKNDFCIKSTIFTHALWNFYVLFII